MRPAGEGPQRVLGVPRLDRLAVHPRTERDHRVDPEDEPARPGGAGGLGAGGLGDGGPGAGGPGAGGLGAGGPLDGGLRDGRRLAVRVLDRDLVRRPLLELVDPIRHDDLERDAELLEDRPPLRRARGENEAAGHADHRAAPRPQSSGKNSPTSRAADSGASEPWTMFWPTSSA